MKIKVTIKVTADGKEFAKESVKADVKSYGEAVALRDKAHALLDNVASRGRAALGV